MPPRTRQLLLLVGANSLLPVLVLGVATASLHLLSNSPFVFDYVLFSSLTVTVLVVCQQVLLLSLWTALYDPKLPAIRWAGSLLILALAAVALAAGFKVLAGQHVFRGTDEMMSHYSLVVASLSFFMGFIEMLAVHVLLWIPRSLHGWRIVFEDREVKRTARRFSLADGLIWIGLVGALLGLSTSFSTADWAFVAAVVALGGTLTSAAIGIPIAILALMRPSHRSLVCYAAWFVLVTIGEFLLIYRTFGFATLPMLSWWGVLPIVAAVNFLLVLVVALNVRVLYTMGARFVGARCITAPSRKTD